MSSVKIMMKEHEVILRMVAVIRKICFSLLQGKQVDYEVFDEIEDFIKNYADGHHHGKEEKIMFQEMTTHLGKMGKNLITHGMLVEHDLGRLHVMELRNAVERVKAGDEESKLDIIAEAIGYSHLIERHIKKEDELIYVYGEKNLPLSVMNEINQKTHAFEEEASSHGVQEKYLALVERLEGKYL